ncbi:hypothetical protein QYE76_020669 [Lolium multiflorum]|uniref:Reverse transcriptase domain-containing protein n=1 Tax=Lolium multiflorum TaxID=4521 RepID=A0AAD8VPG0_LOLMU|nr:hypothetical protein QYE76_020669 [Lolium multiflorum]
MRGGSFDGFSTQEVEEVTVRDTAPVPRAKERLCELAETMPAAAKGKCTKTVVVETNRPGRTSTRKSARNRGAAATPTMAKAQQRAVERNLEKVYGPADHSRTDEFLGELEQAVQQCPAPMVVAGDFNLIRTAQDKNNGNINWPRIRRNVRQFLKGWGANLGKERKVFRADLLTQIEGLDRRADSDVLDEEGWALRYHLEDQLLFMNGIEEEYWRQRSRVKWTLKGDSCMAYFHAIANGRRRKCTIPRLITDQGEVDEQHDLMEHVYSFYHGLMGSSGRTRVDITRLNFGIITLIPKVKGADMIKQFRPIALINIIFKFVAKAYAIRLAPLTYKTIDRSQTPFIRGRCLHQGVLALHDIAHELRAKRLGGLFLKLDFEKAYDRVNWEFLVEVLHWKGFSGMIVHRLMQLVMGGQTTINVNGEVGPFFRSARGVRQGDPLSLILFNFMVDGLAAMLAKANDAGHICGVVTHLIQGVTHLQYADD